MNIALVAPSENAVSETFVRYHKDCMPSIPIYYYGDFTPTHNDVDGLIFGVGLYYYKDKILNLLPGRRINLRVSALVRSFKKHKISVCYAEFGQAGVGVMEACKIAHVPLIVNFHGADISVHAVLNKYRNRYIELFSVAKAIVGVSLAMCNKLESLGCDRSKIIYLPCHPDPKFFTLTANLKSQNILAVGRFVDKKAPYLTLLAFMQAQKKSPDIKLNFVGDGPLLETCINLVRELKVKNVTFYGELPHEKVIELFCDAFVFIQHSVTALSGDSEGTPVSLMEAAAMGIPVVSTRHAGIPDVIEDYKMGYLVDEFDVSGMANRIALLASNSDIGKTLGQYSRTKMKTNFSSDSYKVAIHDILKMALEAK